MKTIVVTRHQALLDYLVEEGIVTEDVPVLSHVTEDDVRGKHVIGVLPLRLAAAAAIVTEVPLDLPQELRGKELSVEEVRKYAGPPRSYFVGRVTVCDSPYCENNRGGVCTASPGEGCEEEVPE